MWGCPTCKKRESRKLIKCPKCGETLTFICAKCYKPLPNGKYNYCGFHLQEQKENSKHIAENVGKAAVGAAVLVVGKAKNIINKEKAERVIEIIKQIKP